MYDKNIFFLYFYLLYTLIFDRIKLRVTSMIHTCINDEVDFKINNSGFRKRFGKSFHSETIIACI